MNSPPKKKLFNLLRKLELFLITAWNDTAIRERFVSTQSIRQYIETHHKIHLDEIQDSELTEKGPSDMGWILFPQNENTMATPAINQ